MEGAHGSEQIKRVGGVVPHVRGEGEDVGLRPRRQPPGVGPVPDAAQLGSGHRRTAEPGAGPEGGEHGEGVTVSADREPDWMDAAGRLLAWLGLAEKCSAYINERGEWHEIDGSGIAAAACPACTLRRAIASEEKRRATQPNCNGILEHHLMTPCPVHDDGARCNGTLVHSQFTPCPVHDGR